MVATTYTFIDPVDGPKQLEQKRLKLEASLKKQSARPRRLSAIGKSALSALDPSYQPTLAMRVAVRVYYVSMGGEQLCFDATGFMEAAASKFTAYLAHLGIESRVVRFGDSIKEKSRLVVLPHAKPGPSLSRLAEPEAVNPPLAESLMAVKKAYSVVQALSPCAHAAFLVAFFNYDTGECVRLDIFSESHPTTMGERTEVIWSAGGATYSEAFKQLDHEMSKEPLVWLRKHVTR